MPLSVLAPTDTRFLFRPVAAELVYLLRGLPDEAWQRPTIAGRWLVRDVAAHLSDLAFRRLSFHRDGMTPPPPPRPITSERDFTDFITTINAEWVVAARRLSPRVLTDLVEKSTSELADWFESLPPDAPALFPVSWAGEQASEGWFDIGREFTELWHHQEQIRMAVGAGSLEDPRFLRAVIEVAIRCLPHAYRNVPAEDGQTISIHVQGSTAGTWTLSRENGRWLLFSGAPGRSTTSVRLSADTTWKLLFNALPGARAREVVEIEGTPQLAEGLFEARSIVI